MDFKDLASRLTTIENPYHLEPNLSQRTFIISSDFYQLAEQFASALPIEIAKSHQKRKISFLAGRLCAWLALSNTQKIPFERMLHSENRMPIWPPNICGSITHTKNLVRAAVGNTQEIKNIGIDSQVHIRSDLIERLSTKIAIQKELDLISDISVDGQIGLTCIFSAKESLFKCLYPLTKTSFYFKDAQIIEIDKKSNHFRFVLLKNLNEEYQKGFSGIGKYGFDKEFAHTSYIRRK